MDICFDIETMPDSAMISRLPEPEVKTGNLKDPAKIAEKIAEAKTEQVGRMALNPLWGRICAFVAIDENGRRTKGCIAADSDTEEADLIGSIFKALAGNRVVTYNGNGFDLPFVYRRAVMLGIDIREYGMPTLAEMTARYQNKHHIDVMQVWCGYGNYEKLDHLGRILFDNPKLEVDFADFPELIRTPEGRDTILRYCAVDVEILKATWIRIAGILI